MAKRGFGLVLVSRNEQKLKETADEIKKDHRVDIKTIVFDFTTTNLTTYKEKLLEPLKKIKVGILGKCFYIVTNNFIAFKSTMLVVLMIIPNDWI